MVPTGDYYPDHDYLFAFLLSARLFIRSHELLESVCNFCDVQQRLGGSTSTNTTTSTTNTTSQQHQQFARHFVKLLAEWIDTFPYDFRDERMMQHVRHWTQRCIAVDGRLRTNVSTMLQQLLNRLTALDQYEGQLTDEGRRSASASSSSTCAGGKDEGGVVGSNPAFPTSLFVLANVDINELCSNSAAQLAQQLTHIELERLAHIGPEEFVQSFAKETLPSDMQQQQQQQQTPDVKKTRNLESYVQWFNRLSYLVATDIVKVFTQATNQLIYCF